MRYRRAAFDPVACQIVIDPIRTDDDRLALTPVPDAQRDHLLYGLKMIGDAAN